MAKKIFLTPSNQPENKYAYGNTNEHDQCGKIAEACRVALTRCGFEVKVAQDVSLTEKCSLSNSWGADLHIPIHTNAYNGKVTGTRMFYYNKNGEGYKACNAIYNVLAPFTPGTSENCSQNQTLVEMAKPKAPSVYIEVDFHDVPEIAKWIINNTTQIGEKIAEGVCKYYGVSYVANKTTVDTSKYEAEIKTLKAKVSELEGKIAKVKEIVK